ncbi:IS1/IS1595 family N-terminal zinc-binding domain-containing protein [Aeromonas media]
MINFIRNYQQSAISAKYPCCDSPHVIHWGRSRGQQHYRCKACSKTVTE